MNQSVPFLSATQATPVQTSRPVRSTASVGQGKKGRETVMGFPLRLALSVALVGTASTSAFSQINNEALGTNALGSITTGDNNVAIGDNAGAAVSSGSANTLVGESAGALHTGSEAVFVGREAGASNTTGLDNTFIGWRAGYTNTTAGDNTFIGNQAGLSNTTGRDNTFVGEEAGKSNTTGVLNTFIGEDAGFNNTEGRGNSALGRSALRDTTVGRYNTAVGHEAGYDITSGARNAVMGNAAGIDISVGVANTMIGDNAGTNTEYADFNTFVGFSAGWDNNRTNSEANANRNTALGAYAGYTNREGEDNVWLGALANSGRWTFNSADEAQFLAGTIANYWNPGLSTSTIDDANSAISGTTVVGSKSAVLSNNGTALGFQTRASGAGSMALGAAAEALFAGSIAIGFGATSKGEDTVVIGNNDTLSWAPNGDGYTALGTPDYRFVDVVAARFSAEADSGADAVIELRADAGEDAADQWRIAVADNGPFTLESSASGLSSPMLTVHSDGDVTVAGDLRVESDQRRKTDIATLGESLALLNQVGGYRYRWRPELGRGDAPHIGFIAQEVRAVLPELVSENNHGTLSVNYQGFVPVLTMALQELHAEQQKVIARQDKEIQALRAELEAQWEVLNQLLAERRSSNLEVALTGSGQ